MGKTEISQPVVRRSTIVKSISFPSALLSRVDAMVAVGEIRSRSDAVCHALRDWLRTNQPGEAPKKVG